MALLGPEGYVQGPTKKNPKGAGRLHEQRRGRRPRRRLLLQPHLRAQRRRRPVQNGGSFSIENIKGKSFSFVSATSTSGFKVPSSGIVTEFGLDGSDELLEGGKFFSEVLFGNSHVGSLVNLLSGDADAAAFDDVDVDMYLDLVSGEANSIGAVYKAKDDAEAPVDSVRGKEFTIIAITPVLNSPICFNEEAISDDDRTKIIDYFCSDKVANDKAIFIDPEDENAKGLFEKDSEKTCFVKTDDAWYEPIRKLAGLLMSEVLGTSPVERQGPRAAALLEGVTKSYDGWLEGS